MLRELIPIISLFSGPGGMDLGFRRQGFLPILAIDADQSTVDTYNLNDRRGIARQGDLLNLSGDEIVALVKEVAPGIRPRGVIGGPPCQSFSVSNVHRKRSDPRKNLPIRYAQILKVLNKEFLLDFFVFENVVGLKSDKHKHHFRKIIRAFEDAGFKIFEQELDASKFKVPQKRRRIFVVGLNKRLYPNGQFEFPEGNDRDLKAVRDAIGGLPEPAYYKRGIRRNDIPYHPNHWAMNPRSHKFANSSGENGRSFRRLKWDEPSWTVAYGNREMHVHPNGIRRVSVFEAMLLQGFPKKYELRGNFTQQVKQVSDAVPPPVAGALAESIKRTIYNRTGNIQVNLLAWFKNNQRLFPWRKTQDPYRILVAEKLLQQTAATEAVIKAYKQIMEIYPDIESLSKASPLELERIIAPLGFVYRAGELTRLAQEILNLYQGRIPTELKDLLNLPGIGDYTARAVLSFAYSQDVPIVDTNIARLLHRIFGISEPVPSNPARNRRLIDMAANLIPKGRARDFNHAALDLCALICKPQYPLCSKCPIRDYCEYGIAVKQKLTAN